MYTKEQRREYQKKYRNNLRQKVIMEKGGVCLKCGSLSNLEFDHRDQKTKKAEISNLIANGASLSVLKAELTKCDLLCRSCHLKKSKESGDMSTEPWNKGKWKHGSTGYNTYKCRCAECRLWKREARKRYKNKWFDSIRGHNSLGMWTLLK